MRRIAPSARSPEFHPPATASLHPPIAGVLEAPPPDGPSSDEVLVPASLLQTFVDESADALESSLLQTLVDGLFEVESLEAASLEVAPPTVEALEESPSIVMGSSRSISTA